MSQELEIERTYLARVLPLGLERCPSKEIVDLYLPRKADHAKLRVRRSGDSYAITKKTPVSEASASIQTEETIRITPEEFKAISRADVRKIEKRRYLFPYGDLTAEIDVFGGKLKGLVLIDFEFKTPELAQSFLMPDFCLADVTEEDYIAGGVLSKYSYAKLKPFLKGYGYQKIS